jgi:4-amino-4-deoxy-L-arabinose transferase-like glycosyltransferase
VRYARLSGVRRADLLNLGILLVGLCALLALVPPARPYAMIDDWAYAQSMQRLLNLEYRPHDMAQPTALAHLAWGGILTLLFGFSFTALTAATLVMSAVGVALLYFVLREFNVSPPHALFGTALLALNPVYVYLSYSFMTDVTFVTFTLAACLCYVRGLKADSAGWLIAGSIFAALSFLTRQLGLLFVPAALAYLWWVRRLHLRDALLMTAAPVVAAAAYFAWERQFPPSLMAAGQEATIRYALAQPLEYLLTRLQTMAVVFSMLGLFLAPVVVRPRRPFLAAGVFFVLATLLVSTLATRSTMFPQNGSIIDNSGFNRGAIRAEPIWSEWVWSGLALVGTAIFALFAARLWEEFRAWIRARTGWERAGDPYILLALLGVSYFLFSTVVSPALFERYMLPILPLLVLFALPRIATVNNKGGASAIPGWRHLLLVPFALFSLMGMADYRAYAGARWEAAEELLREGIPPSRIDAGFEWIGWHLYDEGAKLVRAGDKFPRTNHPPYALLDPVYRVEGYLWDGYEEVRTVQYTSWLHGGQTRRIVVQRRRE